MSLTKEDLDAVGALITKSNESLAASFSAGMKELIAGIKPGEQNKADPAKTATEEEAEKAKALVEIQTKAREEAKQELIYEKIIADFKVDDLDPIAKATYDGMKSRGDIPKSDLANWILRTNASKTYNDCKDFLTVVNVEGVVSKSALANSIEGILNDPKSDLSNLSSYMTMAMELKNNSMRSNTGAGGGKIGDTVDNINIAPKSLNDIKNGVPSQPVNNNVTNNNAATGVANGGGA